MSSRGSAADISWIFLQHNNLMLQQLAPLPLPDSYGIVDPVTFQVKHTIQPFDPIWAIT